MIPRSKSRCALNSKKVLPYELQGDVDEYSSTWFCHWWTRFWIFWNCWVDKVYSGGLVEVDSKAKDDDSSSGKLESSEISLLRFVLESCNVPWRSGVGREKLAYGSFRVGTNEFKKPFRISFGDQPHEVSLEVLAFRSHNGGWNTEDHKNDRLTERKFRSVIRSFLLPWPTAWLRASCVARHKTSSRRLTSWVRLLSMVSRTDSISMVHCLLVSVSWKQRPAEVLVPPILTESIKIEMNRVSWLLLHLYISASVQQTIHPR